MNARMTIAVLLLFCPAGCAGPHPDRGPSKPTAATETVLITYYVIPGREQELQQLLASAWDVYRKEHLVFPEPHLVVRDTEAAGKTRIVEIFTWVNAEAPDHAPGSVKTFWNRVRACCEKRDGHQEIEGGEVALVAPDLPSGAP